VAENKQGSDTAAVPHGLCSCVAPNRRIGTSAVKRGNEALQRHKCEANGLMSRADRGGHKYTTPEFLPDNQIVAERRHAIGIHDTYLPARMAESQGSQADTIARPRRVGNQVAVDYRRLHRGLSLAQGDGDGIGTEVRVVTGAKTKQAASDTAEKRETRHRRYRYCRRY
jgi:hypothetical protein